MKWSISLIEFECWGDKCNVFFKGGLTKLHQQRSIDTQPVDTQLGAPAAKNGSDSEAAVGPCLGAVQANVQKTLLVGYFRGFYWGFTSKYGDISCFFLMNDGFSDSLGLFFSRANHVFVMITWAIFWEILAQLTRKCPGSAWFLLGGATCPAWKWWSESQMGRMTSYMKWKSYKPCLKPPTSILIIDDHY